MRKRDGPLPQQTAKGPGQNDERAPSLPRLKSPRKSGAHTSPSQHRRVRRRPDDPSWRGFAVRLYAPPGSDGAHALYLLLRLAAERYGLAIGDVREISEPPKSND
jgi:hypothetical protein